MPKTFIFPRLLTVSQISEWTLISLSTLVIAARIYLRLVIQKRPLLSSDIVMASAWAMGIVVASFCLTYVHMGVMEPNINYSLKDYDGTEDDKQFILRVWQLVKKDITRTDSDTVTLD